MRKNNGFMITQGRLGRSHHFPLQNYTYLLSGTRMGISFMENHLDQRPSPRERWGPAPHLRHSAHPPLSYSYDLTLEVTCFGDLTSVRISSTFTELEIESRYPIGKPFSSGILKS